MIIIHRPVTIFDVDLVGAGALLVLLLGGAFAIAAPAMRNRTECARVQAEIVAARAEIGRIETARRQMEAGLERYRSSLSRRAQRVPLADGLSPFLARLAACADESGIEIIQLQPAPPQKTPDGHQSDIRVTARGGFADFVRFLDRLRRDNDCQRVTEFSIARSTAESGCALGFTVRLNMLSEPVPLNVAAKSTGAKGP